MTDAAKIAARLRKGHVLHCGHQAGAEAPCTAWWFEKPDLDVPAGYAESLLAFRKIEPQGDGLLPGTSQTYRKRKWARL